MRIAPDTNVLLRAALLDDPKQSRLAATAFREAERSVITLPTLCEFVWVLARGYQRASGEVASAIRALTGSATVVVDRQAVEAGLAALEAGGDFADGIITYEGRRLGGSVFLSFDRKAVSVVKASGGDAQLLSDGH